MSTGRWARRVGVLYLLLASGGMAGAVWVASRFDLPVAGTVAALLPSVSGLYLSWAAFHADRREAVEPRGHRVAEIADRLAVAVRGQWDAEARVRRLNDPYPLPVSWETADERFAESWALLRETAENWPSDRTSDSAGWATDRAELAGTGGEITEVFLRRVPTRRLLLLGGPGSGKTMLLIRLLLSLVAERGAGGAVPVLFPLASWNPGEQTLEGWMAERLARDYTGLGDPQAGHAGQVGHARALLEHRLILPILDGFDEIPARFRGAALDSINAALPLGQPVVLSSRVTEYEDTLGPVCGVPVKLAGAAAVELRPLDAPDIADYLCRDGGGQDTVAAARWEPVIRLLGPTALLEQVRRTFRRLWAVIGLAVGAAFLLCYGIEYAVHDGLPYGLTRGAAGTGRMQMGPPHILDRGLAYGITVGLAAALGHNSWWYYTLARHHLAMRRRLPRDLTAFLADAHERRGVLRQVGAVYQFRHIDLHHHLAGPVSGQGPDVARPPLPRPRFPVTLVHRR